MKKELALLVLGASIIFGVGCQTAAKKYELTRQEKFIQEEAQRRKQSTDKHYETIVEEIREEVKTKQLRIPEEYK